MRELDIEDICRRIAVERPYFAFTRLFTDDGVTLYGEFFSEHLLGYERGPVGIAEIGRHLAIFFRSLRKPTLN